MSGIAERIAAEFHRSYENQAPHFGYETRKDSAVPWTEVPQQNRDLMVSVVHALIAQGVIRPGDVATKQLQAERDAAFHLLHLGVEDGLHGSAIRQFLADYEPVDNGFVCNRLGGNHRLGTTDCPACRP